MDINHELPGKKDVVSVVENNKRVSKRKRLLLGTISNLHAKFLEEHGGMNVSESKFVTLRPKECVIAGSSGTHIVCVCTYHQNPKLMVNAAKLYNIQPLDQVSDCYKYFLSNTPTEACHLRDCENCPSGIDLQEELELYFAEEMIKFIIHNQWKTVDRGYLDTLHKSSAEFIDDFFNQIERLIPHSYIATQQSSFYEDRMTNLQEGEVIINADFSENYSFMTQDMSQASYQEQCTVHPFMCYCRINGDIRKSSFIVISDQLQHNTIAFSFFSAAQYKNRYSVANTFFHEQDFGVPAEWHFFATSHGKCACDGLGGSVKRTAWLHSLRNTDPLKNILNAEALFKWSSENSTTMNFSYASSQEVLEHVKNEETEEFEIINLDPAGMKQSYTFSDTQHTVSIQDILLLVEPNMCKRGQIYKLLAKDIKAADTLFRSWKGNQ
ncbi:Glutamate dehydrogenase [Frankliniella fusca]|uniref:Glutamate dehydrogenase n=1 Tax=Frankliniella fusca TaxID=407009 RepID=A0AAE1HG79_9NEOP|nr:Glutamate dehydrogenase [Frankliniella fusca]